MNRDGIDDLRGFRGDFDQIREALIFNQQMATKQIILDYFGQGEFIFWLKSESTGYIEGFFEWNQEIKAEFQRIDGMIREQDEFWYLDGDGYRLEGELLFKASPWTIVGDGKRQKVVQRFLDYGNGEARFATQPWFRIGDWYNQKR